MSADEPIRLDPMVRGALESQGYDADDVERTYNLARREPEPRRVEATTDDVLDPGQYESLSVTAIYGDLVPLVGPEEPSRGVQRLIELIMEQAEIEPPPMACSEPSSGLDPPIRRAFWGKR